MNQAGQLSYGDLLSLELLKEEGLFFGRLMNQHRKFPKSAAALSLVSMPYIAVIEHDAIPYLNRTFHVGLTHVDTRLSHIRHLTKMLSSSRIDYREYSVMAEAIIQQQQLRFKSNKGFFAPLRDYLQPDVGISYYHDLPVYATYTVAHLLLASGLRIVGDIDEGLYSRELGYAAGTAAASLYSLAKNYVEDEASFDAPEFVVSANDYHFDKISSAMAHRCAGDAVLFFFLSELLIQLRSVKALYLGRLFDDLLWLKFATINLYQVSESIKLFSNYARGDNSRQYPKDLLSDISALVNRDERKVIKKMKPLRNAMIHYDFKPELVSGAAGEPTVGNLLQSSIDTTMHMTVGEYRFFLDSASLSKSKKALVYDLSH